MNSIPSALLEAILALMFSGCLFPVGQLGDPARNPWTGNPHLQPISPLRGLGITLSLGVKNKMNSLVKYGIYAAIFAVVANTYAYLFGKMTMDAAMKIGSGDELVAMNWITVMLVTLLAILVAFAVFAILARLMEKPFWPFVGLSSVVVLLFWIYTANISTPDVKTKVTIDMIGFFTALVIVSVLGFRKNAEE